jgi:SAM-dependent methyltransferase
MNQSEFPPEWFARQDESPDPAFFQEPRLVVHIDDETIEAARAYFATALPNDGVVLDLMSSWRSHLPRDFQGHVVGLGMNDTELTANPQLHERVVHDLNANPTIPLQDARFDAAIVTVSIQYMTRPREIFADVCRVLKPGAQFHVLFSDRMFPTKAVAIWRSMPSAKERGELISTYFTLGGEWERAEFLDRSPGQSADPLYIVRAAKKG